MLWDYIFTQQQVFLSFLQKVPFEQMQANLHLKEYYLRRRKTEVTALSHTLILLRPFLFLFSLYKSSLFY